MTGVDPRTGGPLRNYWGYDPVAFFAPKASYSSAGGLGQQKIEFKEMAQALHCVILDVVFNHTAEGNERGPTLCFRGIDNAIFYMLAPDKRCHRNYAGTGNTINAMNPAAWRSPGTRETRFEMTSRRTARPACARRSRRRYRKAPTGAAAISRRSRNRRLRAPSSCIMRESRKCFLCRRSPEAPLL